MANKKSKPSGLGRGMESLIPEGVIAADFDPSAGGQASSRTRHVLIHDIEPNPEQPRRIFDEAALMELAASIEAHGVLQPLIVVELGNGYRLVAGERRWRAAQKAGLDKVPVIVRSMNEQVKLEVALIENIQREDLSPLEAAIAYARLNKEFNATFESIAKQLGKSGSTVNNIVRLLDLPDPAKLALAENTISEGHARAILAIKEEELQLKLLEMIIANGWSVRKAEQYVKGLKDSAGDAKKAKKETDAETTETKQIGKKLKTKVRIHSMAKGGRLIIDYKTKKDLDRITKYLLK